MKKLTSFIKLFIFLIISIGFLFSAHINPVSALENCENISENLTITADPNPVETKDGNTTVTFTVTDLTGSYINSNEKYYIILEATGSLVEEKTEIKQITANPTSFSLIIEKGTFVNKKITFRQEVIGGLETELCEAGTLVITFNPGPSSCTITKINPSPTGINTQIKVGSTNATGCKLPEASNAQCNVTFSASID